MQNTLNGQDSNQNPITGGVSTVAEGFTPLHIAAEEGNLSLCVDLVQHGVNIDSVSNGVTPLHLAASKGFKHICAFLIHIRCSHSQEA